MALVLTVSLTETPRTGEPYAGNPPVRFGGRGGANPAIPTPIRAAQAVASVAARTTLRINMAIVIGPTPPGLGVMSPAIG